MTRKRRLEIAFQLSLIWLMAGTIRFFWTPEPETALAYRFQLGLVGAGYCLTAILWICSARWSPLAKAVCIAGSCLCSLLLGAKFTNEFDDRSRVLEQPQILARRVIHQSLGVSYEVPRNYRVNLQPMITRSEARQPNQASTRTTRLRFGEMAIVSRLVENSGAQQQNRGTASIILEVQRDSMTDLNAFILHGLQREAHWASVPNITITRPTHLSHTAAADMVEFEFTEAPQQLISRQVYLRSNGFVLNFMLNSQNEADRRLFDEFLGSIQIGRLDSRERATR